MSSSPPPRPPSKDSKALGVLLASKQFRKKAARVVDAVEARREERQTMGWSPREFVLCGLPFRRPTETKYVRRNGHFVFEVVGSSRFGLPFGQDRLIPLWLATAFKICGSPADNVIRFRSASDILRAFGLPLDGAQRKALRERIQRIYGATYFAYDESEDRRFKSESYRLIRRLSLWFDQGQPSNQFTLWQNVIQLDEGFAADIRASAIPVDLESVAALKTSPGALDLYIWQAHRSWELATRNQNSVKMKVLGPMGVLAQFGSDIESPRKARQSMREWHRQVTAVWPECPNRLSEDGEYFVVRPAKAMKKGHLSLPGVSPRPPVPLQPLPVAPKRRDDAAALSRGHLDLVRDEASEPVGRPVEAPTAEVASGGREIDQLELLRRPE